MAEKKIASENSTGRADVVSRTALLKWVNDTLNSKYEKIEELCTGVAYCQLMELFHPKCIAKSKIKPDAKLDYEYTQNFKQLQLAFNKLDIDKTIPFERLIRGKFQDNLEFLQWFKKFYDTHPRKINTNLQTTSDKNTTVPTDETKIQKQSGRSSPKNVSTNDMKSRTPPPEMQTPTVFPVNYLENKAILCELKDTYNNTNVEKNFYFKKLRKIENLLTKCMKKHEHVRFCTQALKIIRVTDAVKKSDKTVNTS